MLPSNGQTCIAFFFNYTSGFATKRFKYRSQFSYVAPPKGVNANYRMRPLFWAKSVTKNKRTCQNADHSAMDGRRVVSSNGSGNAKAIRAVRIQVFKRFFIVITSRMLCRCA